MTGKGLLDEDLLVEGEGEEEMEDQDLMKGEEQASDDDNSNVDYDNISDDQAPDGWIKWFCSLEGHDFLVEIDDEFIQDAFNLYGIKKTERYS